jgi:mRNA interferase MazF
MNRGEIWWADLPVPERSEPGFRRPFLVVQANDFNRSDLNTVICLALTSNTHLAQMPGNVLLSTKETNLPKESVVNVTQVVTLDKSFLTDRVGIVSASAISKVNDGLVLVLNLQR